jgi:hypothetical protein
MSASRPIAVPLPAFNLSFDEALRATYRDPDWIKKVAIGAVFSFLSLILIGAVVVQGYLLAYSERVARAEPQPLPEWDDFGELLRKGAIGTAVSLVYAAPLIVAGIVLGIALIPLLLVAGDPATTSGTVEGLLGLALCGGMAVLLPLGLAVGFVVPAAHAQVILHDFDAGAAFRLREVTGFIRRHLGQYVLMTVVSYAAYGFLSQVGQCACYVGMFLTLFLGQLFQYHLLGQFCWYERIARGQRPVAP